MAPDPAYRHKLRQALDSVGPAGDYAVSGILDSVFPGLEVEEVGPVGLPLTAVQAEAIKACCEPAPYGKGEETRLDKAVRDTWQLDASKVTFCNTTEWTRLLAGAVEKCCKGLGVSAAVQVYAQLYKLLLYETGGHFVPHRDTEKVEGMFGTMDILLPCAFEGGQLVVRHGGKTKCFDLAQDAAYHICYSAFYADCEHEVKPVKSGYRLCLIYNLVCGDQGPPPSAGDPTGGAVQAVKRAVQEWAADKSGPEKLCYVLEHRYTRRGFKGQHSLKGRDRAAARLLVDAAGGGRGLEVNLAILTKHESGYTYDVDEDARYGIAYNEAEVDFEEVTETTYKLSSMVPLTGPGVAARRMRVDAEEEILQDEEFLDTLKESDQRVEPTGNEGTTLDKWYRCAALVIWPTSKGYANMCRVNIQGMVAWLEERLAKATPGAPERQCAAAITDYMATARLHRKHWRSWPRYEGSSEDEEESEPEHPPRVLGLGAAWGGSPGGVPPARHTGIMAARKGAGRAGYGFSNAVQDLEQEEEESEGAAGGSDSDGGSGSEDLPGAAAGWGLPLCAARKSAVRPGYCFTDAVHDMGWQPGSGVGGGSDKEGSEGGESPLEEEEAGDDDSSGEDAGGFGSQGDPQEAEVSVACVRAMLGCLLLLGDAELAGRFLAHAMPGKLRLALFPDIPRLCQHYGWAVMKEPLEGLIEATAALRKGLTQLVGLLYHLATAERGRPEVLPVLLALAEAVTAKLQRERNMRRSGWGSPYNLERLAKKQQGPGWFVGRLVAGLYLVPGWEQMLGTAVDAVLSRPERFSLDAALLPACPIVVQLLGKEEASGCQPFCRLLAHVTAALEQRCGPKPKAPESWAMKATKMTCPCADCGEAHIFLKDPNRREARFVWAGERRKHVQSQLRKARADVKCTEDKSGRTFALVVTKQMGSYDQAVAKHDKDLTALRQLRELLATTDAAPSTKKQRTS